LCNIIKTKRVPIKCNAHIILLSYTVGPRNENRFPLRISVTAFNWTFVADSRARKNDYEWFAVVSREFPMDIVLHTRNSIMCVCVCVCTSHIYIHERTYNYCIHANRDRGLPHAQYIIFMWVYIYRFRPLTVKHKYMHENANVI